MQTHHRIVVVGGGTAGITVAARLRRAGEDDIGIVEPSDTHLYQPLLTLVGSGQVEPAKTHRPMASVMPHGVTWHQDRATGVDPAGRILELGSGHRISYDVLVVAPGIQLDWGRVPGLSEAMDGGSVSSNYTLPWAQRMATLLDRTTSGTAVFTMPSGPIKCAGAPQKIAYLAAERWRRRGDDVHVVLVLPGEKLFGIPAFNAELERVVERYGIEVRLHSEVTEFDPDSREVIVSDLADGTKARLGYDVVHAVPPQSAPDWIKSSPLAAGADPNGYVEVDRHTLQHVRHPEVFALGDAAGSPNAKTGAAVRHQAPVVVANVLAHLRSGPSQASYDGYASCPLVTAHNRMLLAEFDYSGEHHKTIPLIDTTHERYDMWLLKRYGLPAMYWHLMLKGLA